MCDSLNARSAPSLSGSVVAGYERGGRIYSIGADAAEADGCVLAYYAACGGAARYVVTGTADGNEKYQVKVIVYAVTLKASTTSSST